MGDSWRHEDLRRRPGRLSDQRDTIKQSMISERQDQVFEDYVAGVKERMKKDGKIQIYKEVLAQLDEGDAAAEPGFPGGLNFPGPQ